MIFSNELSMQVKFNIILLLDPEHGDAIKMLHKIGVHAEKI